MNSLLMNQLGGFNPQASPSHEKPMNDRLAVIEAERIIAILEDTTEKLGFLDRYCY